MGHLKKDVKITFLDDTPNSSNVSKILKETKKKISNMSRSTLRHTEVHVNACYCLDSVYVLKSLLNIYRYLTVH